MKSLVNFCFNLISRLSFSVLYGISSGVCAIIYHVIGYRKRVVRNNILIAFPEKTKQERRDIERRFYKNFADFIVELLKSFTMKREDYKERIKFTNIELLKQEKDVILLGGHLFNWEWLTGICPDFPQKEKYSVYKKVANNFFDEEVHESRSRFGNIPVTVKSVGRVMMRLPNDGSHIFLFIADQSPHKKRVHYELNFFNRMTPAFNGYDKIARRKEYTVLYMHMAKTARSRYEITLKKISPEGEKFKENEIVEKFYQELTLNIQNQPSIWLWSHKRWKYTSGIDYKL